MKTFISLLIAQFLCVQMSFSQTVKEEKLTKFQLQYSGLIHASGTDLSMPD